MEPAALRAHAEYVHDIRISGAIDVEYYDIHFENLRYLDMDAVDEPLNTPKVITGSYHDDNEDIRFKNPKELTLGEMTVMTVNNRFVGYFWWICARFEGLDFYSMTLPLHNMPSRLCFRGAKRLSLSFTPSLDPGQPHTVPGVLEQLELIKKIPERDPVLVPQGG
ncbi:hypothetical protein BG011_005709 [Mortierella polycephala]|uniref:Uncharacterized protein n=1 Tax=Mortierella polycephala TaxID=41804 RepID=A0A9P6QIK1_9FUNG|nr:hypothetical protein BG011_005709 [Mortierella polycephala]